MRRAAAALFFFTVTAFSQAPPKLPFDINALMSVVRLSDPQISPDATTVAFVTTTVDLKANSKPNNIYTVPLAGGEPRLLGPGNRPRWMPDSKHILFIADRGGSSQIWVMNADGGSPKAITTFAAEADGVTIAPDAKHIVFTSEVFPECGADDSCNQKQIAAAKAAPTKARIYDSLLYRHWTTWQGPRRSHILSAQLDPATFAVTNTKDLTPGPRIAPPFSLGGPDDYAISPDSTEVCFVMNTDDDPSTSTNGDLFAIPIGGGESRRITTNPGNDASPQYSPDGKMLGWLSQQRAGYESDRFRLLLMDRASGSVTVATDLLDRWINGFAFTPDSTQIFFTAVDRGRQSIRIMPAAGGAIKVAVSGDNMLDDMQVSRDGKLIVFTRQSLAQPIEIMRGSSTGGPPVALTHMNDKLFDAHPTTPAEELTTTGSEDAQIQSFVVKPPDFDASKKYPALLLIHGGPQGEWGQSWTYRWNAEVFAAAGYVVVMPNPRGSVGYGQKFIDDVNKDWGGRAYQDIMAVTDQVAALPYVDKDRMVAAGASYGGYMIDWILGHTDRFKALVSHAGVFNTREEAASTEELWFPKWEFAGMPWENPELYDQWSPNLYAKEFKTPTLVIHGELDFRIPYTQGLELFTTLQMQKVPSKLLIFPDEGHWILKPQNSVLWYQTVIGWLDGYAKK